MIQAKDLRIGNLVERDGEVYEIVAIHASLVEIQLIKTNKRRITSFEDKGLTSIPLTEEWLKKFGFVKREANLYTYTEIHKVGVFELSDINGCGYRLWVGSGTTGKDLKYVHQLQNLFFALCGEELTTKES